MPFSYLLYALSSITGAPIFSGSSYAGALLLYSSARVSGSATPVALKPILRWKDFTASAVALSK